jgi:archaemetzincin
LKDDPDFPRKPPPQPGEWLSRFKERGQTVEQYKEECGNRRREGRETIVIQPMGGILSKHADTMESVREYCGLYYGCPAEIAQPVKMPAETFVKARRQYDADRILIGLRNEVPAKALAYFGFCEEDLYSEGLNYVFGLASLRERAGVYSLARYGAKDAKEDGEPVFLKRTLKVASHELGHMYGLEHCVRYLCNLNGSNSVREMDQEPVHLCPECLEKVRWNTGVDVAERYRTLARFYEKSGLKKDAAFALKQAGKVSGAK